MGFLVPLAIFAVGSALSGGGGGGGEAATEDTSAADKAAADKAAEEKAAAEKKAAEEAAAKAAAEEASKAAAAKAAAEAAAKKAAEEAAAKAAAEKKAAAEAEAKRLAEEAEAKKAAAIADTEAKLKAAQDQYDTLFGDYNNTLDELAKVSASLGDMTNNYKVTTSNYGDLKNTYDELYGKYNTLTSDLAGYKTSMDELSGKYDTLYSDYTGLSGSNEELLGKYDDLTGKYDTLSGSYDTLNNRFTETMDAYKAAQEKMRSDYVTKVNENARSMIAETAANKEARMGYTPAAATAPAYTDAMAGLEFSKLDPGSYNAPVIDYVGGLNPNITAPIDLNMPAPDFTTNPNAGQYGLAPLQTPGLDFNAPFQPYLNAVREEYGSSVPSAYTGIMGGLRT